MRNRSPLRIVMLALLLCLLSAQPVLAQSRMQKAGRGVTNLLTGWVEIPKQIHNGAKQANGVTGIVGGVFRGISLTFLRMGVGAYEALTFPIEVPAGYVSPYKSMELPDYAWE